MVWADGHREMPDEDYAPSTVVREMQSGTFSWDRDDANRGDYTVEWLPESARQAVLSELGHRAGRLLIQSTCLPCPSAGAYGCGSSDVERREGCEGSGMTDFGSRFIESRGEAIEFNGRLVHMAHVMGPFPPGGPHGSDAADR